MVTIIVTVDGHDQQWQKLLLLFIFYLFIYLLHTLLTNKMVQQLHSLQYNYLQSVII